MGRNLDKKDGTTNSCLLQFINERDKTRRAQAKLSTVRRKRSVHSGSPLLVPQSSLTSYTSLLLTKNVATAEVVAVAIITSFDEMSRASGFPKRIGLTARMNDAVQKLASPAITSLHLGEKGF